MTCNIRERIFKYVSNKTPKYVAHIFQTQKISNPDPNPNLSCYTKLHIQAGVQFFKLKVGGTDGRGDRLASGTFFFFFSQCSIYVLFYAYNKVYNVGTMYNTVLLETTLLGSIPDFIDPAVLPVVTADVRVVNISD
jgi:hypothetical protein